MRVEDFTADQAGQLVRALQGYWAFAPQPLPPPLGVSWELVRYLSEADRALSELAGQGRTLPNPHLLINAFIGREAVLSSRIEGTQASLSDLFYFEAAGTPETETSDVREVANYVHALRYGLERIKELPISLRLIRELHGILMQGVRGQHQGAGDFRRVQNWIGGRNCALQDATYVPPPPAEMHEALDRWEKYLHAPAELPPLIRLALVHYQFEAIHPFFDGNGRIGRLLISLLLVTEGLLPQPLLYLSAYFERNRPEYYRRLLAITQAGDWTGWLVFFLQGVTEQARDATRRAAQLLDLRQAYSEILHAAQSSALPLRLVDDLFSYPAVTTARAAALLKVTPRAAQKNIEKLAGLGILREVTGRRRNRVFVAPTILTILEAPEAP